MRYLLLGGSKHGEILNFPGELYNTITVAKQPLKVSEYEERFDFPSVYETELYEMTKISLFGLERFGIWFPIGMKDEEKHRLALDWLVTDKTRRDYIGDFGND